MNQMISDKLQGVLSQLLEKGRTSKQNIKNLLDLIRITYSVETVYVFEHLGNCLDFRYSFISTDLSAQDVEGVVIHATNTRYNQIVSVYDEEGFYYKIIPDSFTREHNIKSGLHYANFKNGRFEGAIGFYSKTENRAWTEEEKQVLKELTKVVYLYLSTEKYENRFKYRDVEIDTPDNTYFTSIVWNLENDDYNVLQVAPWLKKWIVDDKDAKKRIFEAGNVLILKKYRDDFFYMFSKEYICNTLTDKIRSFSYDYRTKRGNAIVWARVSATVIASNKDGTPRTVLITIQDLDARSTELEDSRKAFVLMRDAYYRISSVDLNNNVISNIKIIENEIDNENCLETNYDNVIKACIDKYVAKEYRNKFSNLLNRNNLKNWFSVKQEPICFSYQRYVEGELKWVQSEIVPVDNYSENDAQVIWYVKNISAEKAKEQEYNDKMLEANVAIRGAYDVANRANNAKTDFLSRMSHDIRTPMNAIIGMTAIAGVNLEDKNKLAYCLSKINVASKHLLNLINEILDMNKIESGKMILSEEEISLPNLIDDLLEIVYPSVKAKNHELNVHIQNIKHEKAIGDSLRMQQVFVNILNNAVKYTQDGGKIDLYVIEKPSKVRNVVYYEFVFQDNGIGMSKEFLQKLFEPFERADDEAVRKEQGTGLGMAITRNIVLMMNGELDVESDLGKGSKFTVKLCLKVPEENIEFDLNKHIDLHILVVDNDKDICENTCNMLNDIGMSSEWVDNGYDAIKKVAQAHNNGNDFYAVIVDWKMPDIDGIDIIREIRNIVGDDIVIIILSAYDWSEIEKEAIDVGVTAFISKPIFKSKLVNVLNNVDGMNKSNIKNEDGINLLQRENFDNKRVLVVEDNELNREIAIEFLEMTGVNIDIAVNGKEAVEKFKNSDIGYYDLIFMDIQMPIMNGLDATREIRKMTRKDSSSVPIVAMTANAFVSDVQNCMSAGMNEHLAKPIELTRLRKVLKHWLQ